jgi:hypothetical protein
LSIPIFEEVEASLISDFLGSHQSSKIEISDEWKRVWVESWTASPVSRIDGKEEWVPIVGTGIWTRVWSGGGRESKAGFGGIHLNVSVNVAFADPNSAKTFPSPWFATTGRCEQCLESFVPPLPLLKAVRLHIRAT